MDIKEGKGQEKRVPTSVNRHVVFMTQRTHRIDLAYAEAKNSLEYCNFSSIGSCEARTRDTMDDGSIDHGGR